MRGVCKAKYWPAHPKLYAVAVIKRRRRGNALVVDERAVKASKVMKHELAVQATYLGVTARDDRCVSFNRNFHLRVAAHARHVLAQLYAT